VRQQLRLSKNWEPNSNYCLSEDWELEAGQQLLLERGLGAGNWKCWVVVMNETAAGQ
ncbi:hypothetical protein BGX21_005097, partial [Mortierella sp. AD011]